MAGYSGTPLSRKLGVGPGMRVALIAAPPRARDLLAPLPLGVTLLTQPRGRVDVIVFFTVQRQTLVARVASLGRLIHPAGALWIAWPKRASKVPTDMTEDVVREVALPLGLVDNKVAAIDDTWSGLKLVWRLERR